MSQVIGKFLEIFNECKGGISLNLETPKDIKIYLEKQLDKLSIGLKEFGFQNNVFIVIHFLLSENNNDKMEKIKKEILMKLVNEEKINVFSYASKIRYFLGQEIYDMRKKIISIVSEQIKDIKYDEDALNELYFFSAIRNMKYFIKNFSKEYKTTQFKFNDKFFKVIDEFQSFNLSELKNLYLYLNNFNIIYNIYKLFIPIIQCIKNIINHININNKNNYIVNNINNTFNLILNLMEKNVFSINSRFEHLENKMKSITDEIKKINDKNQKLENNVIILHLKNQKLENYIKFLCFENKTIKKDLARVKKNYDSLGQYLECPIKKDITRWIRYSHKSPYSKRSLGLNDLIKNYALKNLIDEYIKNK